MLGRIEKLMLSHLPYGSITFGRLGKWTHVLVNRFFTVLAGKKRGGKTIRRTGTLAERKERKQG